ncbi:alpha/beta hydrolase [Aquabacterium sp. OR-4]|uniref:alpha/beta hydrolase n=1 Tax=Aquabacterium sp. OR-4 TaxID=2978127 RepID=UPI0028CACF69|nr:alpha/beta hydrolase [Aquabacterium sp. OR-4]MDT7838583.1 alpha/beta hydrolase [Aquabacterium sp. OR-4]
MWFSLCLAACLTSVPCAAADSFAVTLDPAQNGRYTVDPAVPANGRLPAGTVLTVTAQPNAGYALDSGYYAVPGRWGVSYHESMTPRFKVTVTQDMRIGASFIRQSELAHVVVRQDIVYAKPGVKPLKYDVFTPKGAKGPLPIVVIIHGGGWVSNDENIMRGLARELTRGAEFVVASIDYRWAGKADGDATGNSMANLVEDVYGAIAHIMAHASTYGGDASRIVLTGDSAGGHLAAVASLMVDRIGDGGFGRTAGVFEFKPSYLPKGKASADVRAEMSQAIKGAAPSYGVFGGPLLSHHSDDPAADDGWKAAIEPIRHIPPATVRAVPQYLTRGTEDPVITDAMCKAFVEGLVAVGQRAEYVQIGGANHAFFDWSPDASRQATFKRHGVYHAARMKAFFASVVNP